MSKQPEEYLKHILDEIEFVLGSASDLSEEKFMHDETLQRAYSRSLEIIGEATKKLSKEFTDKHSQVDWGLMAGMRDKLIHHYFGVDYAIVWDVIKNELPKLKPQIQEILQKI
ncbi:DUF86 domain-containing protein [Patescibacteria group bacterium]|nr:DUF86 domain-containing protein [Patescibacteria group bacterium]